MPTKLSTTIKQITTEVSNPVNSALINDFYQYMKANGASERHQNNNLKAIIAFAKFIGPDIAFYGVKRREDIIDHLNFDFQFCYTVSQSICNFNFIQLKNSALFAMLVGGIFELILFHIPPNLRNLVHLLSPFITFTIINDILLRSIRSTFTLKDDGKKR
jgi:hypothetical protein